MIETIGLRKDYGPIRAVENVTFEVHPGEVLGFLGPNGAGKTTTLRIITSYLPATEGTARVAGFDVARQSIEVRRRIGYLPESNPLYEEMRVGEYLDFRARLKRSGSRKERRKRLGAVLETCQITHVERRIIGQLSKGYRQRVGLADALVADPPVVILDEPTAGLDPHQVRRVREIVRELGREKTVILSTHILTEAELLCDRLLIIDRGRIVGRGTVNELAASCEVAEGPGALEEIFVQLTSGADRP